MALSNGALNAGKAAITLSLVDDKRISQALNSLESRMKSVGRSMQTVATAGLQMASALAVPFAATLKFASDAAEGLNKFNSVFGSQAAMAEQFATTLANTVGRSKTEIRDAMSSFQGFFVGLGFAPTKARELSSQLASLSLDFASFHNLSDQEAMERFISALSGSSEVLDRFGINIKQAALEQQLLAQGVKKSWTEVTEQEKAIARLNVIMQAMTSQGAVGDAVKTSGSFANQLKAVQAKLKDIAVEIGNTLLPVATKYLGNVRELAMGMATWVSQNSELFVSLATTAVKVGLASAALLGLAKVIGGVTVAVTALRVAITFLTAHPIVLLVAAVGMCIVEFLRWTGLLDRIVGRLGELANFSKQAAAEVDGLAEATKQLADQEARRAELAAQIAANRAATGNPWGINADRPKVGASGPDSDPLNFGSMQGESDVKKVVDAAKNWWQGFDPMADVRERFKQLLANLEAATAPKQLEKVAPFSIDQPHPGATLDPRLVQQVFGGSNEVSRQQLEVQRQMLAVLKSKKGGLPVA